MARQRRLTRAIAIVAVLVAGAAVALAVVARQPDTSTVRVAGAAPTGTAPPSTASLSTGSSSTLATMAIAAGSTVDAVEDTSSSDSVTTATTSTPMSTSPVDSSSTTTTTPPSGTARPFGPDAVLLQTGSWQTGSQIWAIDPDGSGKTMLLDGVDVWDIAWAPGHAQFAWQESAYGDQGRRIHLVNTDGSGERVLAHHTVDGSVRRPYYGLSFSPDGRLIAESCDGSTAGLSVAGLCTVDTTTGDVHDLTVEFGLSDPGDGDQYGNPPQYSVGSWDPTGRRLTYDQSTQDGDTRVEVVDFTTGTHWTLAEHLRPDARSVFTADGGSVLYGPTERSLVEAVPATGGVSQPVPGATPTDRSPDGTWFLSSNVGNAPVIFDLAGESRSIPDLPPNVLRARW